MENPIYLPSEGRKQNDFSQGNHTLYKEVLKPAVFLKNRRKATKLFLKPLPLLREKGQDNSIISILTREYTPVCSRFLALNFLVVSLCLQ